MAGRFPWSLQQRVLLGNLRDNVRGEPRLFSASHVRRAEFTARVTRQGSITSVRLGGQFLVSAPAGNMEGGDEALIPAGIKGELAGELIYDGDSGRPIRFRMLAQCLVWGDHPTTPCAPSGRYPLRVGFALTDDKDRLATVIPPHAAGTHSQVLRYLNSGACFR